MSIFDDRQQQNFYLAMLGVVGLLVIAQAVWAVVRGGGLGGGITNVVEALLGVWQ